MQVVCEWSTQVLVAVFESHVQNYKVKSRDKKALAYPKEELRSQSLYFILHLFLHLKLLRISLFFLSSQLQKLSRMVQHILQRYVLIIDSGNNVVMTYFLHVFPQYTNLSVFRKLGIDSLLKSGLHFRIFFPQLNTYSIITWKCHNNGIWSQPRPVSAVTPWAGRRRVTHESLDLQLRAMFDLDSGRT